MSSSIHVRRGKDGRVAWGSGPQNLGLNNAKITERADKIDYTTFESPLLGSGTCEENTIGVQGCDLEFEGDWDAAVNRYDSPPNVTPTDAGGPAKTYLSKTDATFWLHSVLAIFSSVLTLPVRGKTSFNFSAVSNGTYTRPTGSY